MTVVNESPGGVLPGDIISEKHHIGAPLTEGLAEEPGEEVMPELTGLEGPGAQASIVSTDSHSPEEEQYCQQRIKEIDDVTGIPEQEKRELLEMLEEHHTTFSLVEGERGETNLEIDTGHSARGFGGCRSL